MRTKRRSLASATTFAPVLLAAGLLGVGMLGVQPAAAAAPDTSASQDCGSTSIGPDGMLDAELLQTCLGAYQASLLSEGADDAPTPPAPEPEVVAANVDFPTYDAIDIVFPIALAEDLPSLGGSAEPVVEESAPVDDGMGDAFAALRDCESGGDYGINTGNGYYGAYQFSLETWQGIGYGGYPHEASPAVQDQAARDLQALYGWSQWPDCSWYLGLG